MMILEIVGDVFERDRLRTPLALRSCHCAQSGRDQIDLF
jgi:hypothetical protein